MGYQDKQVVVTGAGGFIGSHLCERLVREGAKVRAMLRYTSHRGIGNLAYLPADVRSGIELVYGDVREAETLVPAFTGQDVVFHLAALIGIPYSYIAPRSYTNTIVLGTQNVLETCRMVSTPRVVCTSTSEVYGTARYTPMDEGHPLQGQSPYSAAKIGADKMCEAYHLAYGVPVVTVRPFNTYGPRQSARAVIPTIIGQVLSHSPVVRLGSLAPRRDLLFVADTVEGFAQAGLAQDVTGRVINLGTGTSISIGELAVRLITYCGSTARIEETPARIRPEQSEVQNLVCDATLAKTLLGWEPKTPLSSGLMRVIEWMTQHPEVWATEYTR